MMTTTQLTNILTPLHAAYDYALLARDASGEDRAKYEALMLNRLQHAAENAGLIRAELEKAA